MRHLGFGRIMVVTNASPSGDKYDVNGDNDDDNDDDDYEKH